MSDYTFIYWDDMCLYRDVIHVPILEENNLHFMYLDDETKLVKNGNNNSSKE